MFCLIEAQQFSLLTLDYYLENKIRFPFQARCIRAKAVSPLLKGERVEVRRLAPEDACSTDEAYGAGGSLLWRYTGSSTDPNQRAFVPFNGRILAEYYAGATIFDHPDEIGSMTTSSDYTGNNLSEKLFYPFGEPWTGAAIPNLNMHQTFAQLPDYDSETDQYNTANRHYNPTGRWLSPDPGGVKVVNLQDPQTWNMYAYVLNNPTTFTDPTGEACVFGITIFGYLFGGRCEGDSPPPPPPPPPPQPAATLQASDANHAAADKNPAVLKATSSSGNKTGGEIQYDLVEAPGDRQNYQIGQAESYAPRSGNPSGVSVSEYPNQFLDEIQGLPSGPNSIQTFYMTPIDKNGVPTGPPQPVNIKDLQGNTFYSLGVYMNQTDYRTYVNGQMVSSPSFLPPPGGVSSY